MNIDSLNLFSRGSFAEEGATQQVLTDNESISFLDTLTGKIKQLQEPKNSHSSIDHLSINASSYSNELREIASLANRTEEIAGFSALLGKELPQGNKVNKEIDLENILGTLENVLNTIEGQVPEENKLSVKLDVLIEDIQAIKIAIPEQIELNQKLSSIVDKFEELKQQHLINEYEVDNRVGHILKNQQTQDVVTEEARENGGYQVFEDEQLKRLDEIENGILQIKDFILFKGNDASKEADLNRKIETIAKNIGEKNGYQVFEGDQLNGLDEIEDDIQKIKDFILVKGNDTYKGYAIDKQIEPITKDNGGIKNLVSPSYVDKLLGTVEKELSTKPELEGSFQQENKSNQNNEESIFLAKQASRENILDVEGLELVSEKVAPKFAIDIANLNRAVMIENKADIPPMTKHFAHPEWNKEMGERVIWMHKKEIPSAELRLNPGHLGPIKIKIDISQEQVTVAFTTQHAAVKEAIDAALPRLREMFSAQQLNLSDVSVAQEDAGQRQSRSFGQMGGNAGKGSNKDDNEIVNSQQSEDNMDIADEIEAGRAIASNGVLSIFA